MTHKLIRVDAEVTRYIEEQQRPRESYNDVLRRLFGIGVKVG